MKAIERLRHEHKMILRMLDHLERSFSPFSAPAIARCLHFFVDWVDEIHHVKEEEVLFAELVHRGRDFALGPVQVMRKEHAVARAYLSRALRVLSAGHQPRSRELLKRYVDAFVALQREHVDKEDRVLFTLCEQLVPPSLDEDLLRRFGEVTEGRLDREAIVRYERFAEAPNDTMVVRRPKEPITEKSRVEPLDAKTLTRDDEEDGDTTHMSARAGMALYDDGVHRVLRLHDFGHGLAVQANQFLLVNDGEGMILDPGGPKVYPNVYAETMMELHEGRLRWVFLSHQDPDICTSLNAWLMDTEADALSSKLWMRFLPHFGIDRLLERRLKPIPDAGMRVPLGRSEQWIVPAHFLHSCGNFQIYDPISKILFSGDLGASVGVEASVVDDFDAHLPHMAGFHRRYMASTAALRMWADLAEKLDIETIAPQHGPSLKGRKMVKRFIDWCRTLECGVDAMGPYQIPR